MMCLQPVYSPSASPDSQNERFKHEYKPTQPPEMRLASTEDAPGSLLVRNTRQGEVWGAPIKVNYLEDMPGHVHKFCAAPCKVCCDAVLYCASSVFCLLRWIKKALFLLGPPYFAAANLGVVPPF
eukprot:1154477-Pelagomonas_calceolata.AAC.1